MRIPLYAVMSNFLVQNDGSNRSSQCSNHPAQSRVEIWEFTQTMDGFTGSKHNVLQHVNNITLPMGFGMVITRSYRRVIILACRRSGQPRTSLSSEINWQKEARLHKCNCPFELFLVGGSDTSWRWNIRDGHHNHPPSAVSAIPQARHLPSATAVEIQGLLLAGITPRRIQLTLSNAHPNLPLLQSDIKNYIYHKSQIDCTGHTASDAIIAKLSADGDLFQSFIDSEGRLIGLLYTTPTARSLCRRFSTVLLVDCTYKTNKHKFPCFRILGFTAANSYFTAAVVFMLRETTDWYERSLKAFLDIMGPGFVTPSVILSDREPALAQALVSVLPAVKHIFCLWHIEKNIATNCKTGLSNEEFNTFMWDWKNWIVGAESHVILADGILSLESKYKAKRQFASIMDYIDGLLHDRIRYVHAWIDLHLHLGQRNTSRVEGGASSYEGQSQ